MKDKAIEFLESLVSSRFNEQSLNKHLSEFFEVEVKVENISKDDDDLADYNYIFNIDTKHLFIDIDIYFLKHRKVGFDDATFYITEVAYNFE
jgi:hypothetical protein